MKKNINAFAQFMLLILFVVVFFAFIGRLLSHNDPNDLKWDLCKCSEPESKFTIINTVIFFGTLLFVCILSCVICVNE